MATPSQTLWFYDPLSLSGETQEEYKRFIVFECIDKIWFVLSSTMSLISTYQTVCAGVGVAYVSLTVLIHNAHTCAESKLFGSVNC